MRFIDGAQTMQRPQRVDRADIEAERVDRLGRSTVSISCGTTSGCPRSTSSRCAWRRQNRLSFASVATSSAGVALLKIELVWRRSRVVNDAIDSAMLLVAEIGFVGVHLRRFRSLAAWDCAARCSCTSR